MAPGGPWRTRHGWALVALGAVASISIPLLAQEDRRSLHTEFRDETLYVDASMAEFLERPADGRTGNHGERTVRDRIECGLPQVLELRIDALSAQSGLLLARRVRSHRVVFDLWEERFRVQPITSASPAETFDTLEEVLARTLVAERLAVGDPTSFRSHHGESIELVVRAQLNPPTPEAVHRIRRWLARPGGAAETSDSFFGSFVGLFVSRSVSDAEAEFSVRSTPIEVP